MFRETAPVLYLIQECFQEVSDREAETARAEAIVRTEQIASAETARTEQTASAETARAAMTVSAEAARAAMTVSAEAARTVIQEPDGRTESRHFLHLAECR